MLNDLLFLDGSVNWTAACLQALLHSLWMGTFAAVGAGVVLASTVQSRPVIRYNLLFLLSFLFLVGVFVVFFNALETDHTALYSEKVSVRLDSAYSPPLYESGKNTGFVNKLSETVAFYSYQIGFIWLAVFLAKLLKMLAGLWALKRYSLKDLVVPQDNLATTFEILAKEAAVKCVQLRISNKIKTPCTAGFLRPFVLIPLELLCNLPAEQLECIILHELAHVKRRDYLMNLYLELMRIMFFFNPGILWLLFLLRQEREVCCDHMVAEKFGRKKEYIQSLMAFQEHLQLPLALNMTGTRYFLLDRIKAIVLQKNRGLEKFEITVLAAMLLLLSAMHFYINPDTKPVALPHIINDRLIVQNSPLKGINTPLHIQSRKSQLSANRGDKSEKTKLSKNSGQHKQHPLATESMHSVAPALSNKMVPIHKNRVGFRQAIATSATPQSFIDSMELEQKKNVGSIIQYLINTSIITDTTSIPSFSLTTEFFLINGVRQPESLHQHLVTSFNVEKGRGLFFGSPPPNSTGFFFHRHDIALMK